MSLRYELLLKKELKTMGFFSQIKRKLSGTSKEIEITPREFGAVMVDQVFKQWVGLHEEAEEYMESFSTEEISVFQLWSLQELFCFFYSLFSLAISSKLPDKELTAYGSQLLLEARETMIEAMAEKKLPESFKGWLQDNDQFTAIFSKSFRYYYHDQVDAGDIDDLAGLMRFIQLKDKNSAPLGYLTLKLVFQLTSKLRISNDSRGFVKLWCFYGDFIPSLTGGVLSKVQPIMK